MNKLEHNVLARHWDGFESYVDRVLRACKTREECMAVADYLNSRSLAIQRLIDDGCYQRAFDLDNATDEP